ncbi:bifunctional prephenate dehydrogenase/3-phosphoshikimate 1-carboxyvinyltransferase [Agaribacterium haliotis]|uniref:bifunctional prephenate dehydrogenase/3-phosphoshikimate 1-carboxyvinyltransferase n=1 Tax=Agaribacterium haliotis TaxID=2013869 RepID=UPI000BB53693|nr:bifunctional prephenate dehydrogenase/3-phosphoshikimate 1-carboxyvinyltransferase [Agaribacterium haliotis]
MAKTRTLVVIGLGLIGGSLAAAARKNAACERVIGIARRAEVCERALELGVVDEAVVGLESIAAELGEGDVVFISVPTLSTRSILEQCQALLAPTVTITDGASVKGSVREDARAVYGDLPAQLVLGHPIAGSEKSGVDAANAELYINHRVILTPAEQTGASHLARVRELWQKVGADVLEMDVDLHDEVLASTSHLPHAIAYSLVDTLAHDSQNENIFRYAAGGFRDFTRIASSDATMWRDIMLANKQAVLSAIDMFLDNMGRLRTAVENEDVTELTGVFTRAKAARDRFTLMLSHQAYSSSMSNPDSPNVTYIAEPGGQANGEIRVPGDKSISHRSIMLGSLAEGTTHVEGFLEGEDALATLQTFRDMGVVIEGPENGKVTVHGVGLHGLKKPAGSLYVGNSGTSMRLLSGILAGQPFASELTGDESLTKRPMNRVAIPLRALGASIDTAENGRPPMQIRANEGGLKGIHYDMPMASAQVKSCVLLAGLYADGETSVSEPAPTRDHTERMLRGFGYDVKREGNVISLKSGGKLTACNIDIPADISSAAFFLVAGSITPGADLTLTHVGINPTRDGVINILRMMGADITLSNEREIGGETVADIRVRHAKLKGIQVPEEQVPLAIDEFPVLCIAAACAEGRTVVSGAEELRVKETDRIQAMADGLVTLGVKCETTDDGIIVEGGPIGGGEVESFGDHRIAMSFTVASLAATDTITVRNCANVATSFPNFAELATKIGIKLDVISQ